MGRFAVTADVTSRFEGTIPTDRLGWVDLRITDVENVLIGLVPSLAVPPDQIDPIRLARVKTLVCEKVLDLYRNPERANQRTQTAGPYSDAVNLGTTPKVWFTDDDLRLVRLRNKRANLGTAKVAPWHIRRPPWDNPWGSPGW